MLIKPITETKTPRHTLDDDDYDDNQPHYKPEISIKLTKEVTTPPHPKNILVLPSTISIIQDQLKLPTIGTVSIKYPELYESIDKSNDLEYDEDEQLYVALKNQNLKTKYPELEIPIVGNDNVVGITIPHFYNVITYNLVSKKIIEFFDSTKNWIVLAPCGLNNNQSVNKLLGKGNAKDDVSLNQVPDLKPPHAITGISAALVSQLNLRKGDYNIVCLVLNSEGQPGFEKSDNDSIVDTSYLLGDLLKLPHKEDYLNEISKQVRKFNGAFSNLAMYI
ncbi:hypothetical protein G210_0015 [Candida maltosa Xu316]|uniref:Proteasome assembly chaperone 1 n=1 Tax=Candida maltosa (strain Xu316) TaxID=1245528 RepID=M3K3F9_CANMX|nr:hypothetical protein G210_0015 [Candida maltosa Xu316]